MWTCPLLQQQNTIELAAGVVPAFACLLVIMCRRFWRRAAASEVSAASQSCRDASLHTTSLEGLRGLITLHVGLYHFVENLLPDDVRDMVRLNGEASVPIFYLLSGFVLTLGYGDHFVTNAEPSVLWGFLVKRTARLLPSYYLSNVCMYMVIATVYDYYAPTSYIMETAFIVTQLDIFKPITPVNETAWTIGVLIFFYVAFPLIAPRVARAVAAVGSTASGVRSLAWDAYWLLLCLMWLGRSGILYAMHAWLACLSGCAVFQEWVASNVAVEHVGWSFNLAYNFAPVQLPAFIMGCVAAHEAVLLTRHHAACGTRSPPPTYVPSSNVCTASFFALIAIGAVATRWLAVEQWLGWKHGDGDSRLFLYCATTPVGYAWIIALTVRESASAHAPRPIGCGDGAAGECTAAPGWADELMLSRPLRKVGEISLAYYLMHTAIFTYLNFLLNLKGASLAGYAIAWCSAIGVGWAQTQYFEKPMARVLAFACLPKAPPPASTLKVRSQSSAQSTGVAAML